MPHATTRSVRVRAGLTTAGVEQALAALPAHLLGTSGRTVRARTDAGAAGWGELITVALAEPGADRAEITVEPVHYLSIVSELSARRVAARVARALAS